MFYIERIRAGLVMNLGRLESNKSWPISEFVSADHIDIYMNRKRQHVVISGQVSSKLQR